MPDRLEDSEDGNSFYKQEVTFQKMVEINRFKSCSNEKLQH